MPRGYLSLVVELHHPLPAPGEGVDRTWGVAACETYWPVLRAVTGLADSGLAEVLTLAVSSSWTALAAEPRAQELAAAELDKRVAEAARQVDAGVWLEHWQGLRLFATERWGSDLLAPLRRAHEAGTIEVITTTASHAWLPGVADVPVLASAQVGLAAADHHLRFGGRAAGLWLPHLAYLPGLERTMARSGVRYFGVDAEAFRRGTVRPPCDVFGPLITRPGVAAFGVDPGPTLHLTDSARRYCHDPRYGHPALGAAAVVDHVAHFLDSWRNLVQHAPRPREAPAISVAAVSAHELGGSWRLGAEWLEQMLRRLGDGDPWSATTPGRYLDRYPEGPVGRPGPSAGGILSVRPAGSNLIDRCRIAAETLADAVERRGELFATDRRAVAQMVRALLAAQSLDWHLPPGLGLGPEQGLARAQQWLAQFGELAGLLAAGRIDHARLATHEAGPAYLPDIDLDPLAEGTAGC